MLKKIPPHRPSLHGYTLPLVISVLDTIGPPLAISKVDDADQQGPLLATLAFEVSSVAVILLHESLVWGVGREELNRHCIQRGGQRYLDAVARELDLHRAIEDMLTEAQAIENRVLRLNYAEYVDRKVKKGTYTQCVSEGFLLWVKPLRSEAKNSRARYEEIRTLLPDARSAFSEAAEHLRKLKEELQEHAPKVERKIFFDFDTSHPFVEESAVGILQRTDRKWWRAFEATFQREHQLRLSRGMLGLILRDSALPAAVHRMRSVTSEEARIKFVRDSRQFSNLQWPNDLSIIGILTEGNLRKRRQILREEDKAACTWINQQAGSYHPYSYSNSESPGQTFPECELSLARAFNELYWCLCRGTREAFTPMYSLTFSADAWQAWLENSENRTPGYYRRPM